MLLPSSLCDFGGAHFLGRETLNFFFKIRKFVILSITDQRVAK